MKRYELAKNKGISWEVVLVSDAETDLKIIIRDCVILGLPISVINDKVIKFIKETTEKLENERIKRMVRMSFPAYATKLYHKWLLLFGTQAAGIAFLEVLKRNNVIIPKKVQETLKTLPKMRDVKRLQSIDAIIYNRATAIGIYSLEYEREIHKRINEIADMSAKTDYSTRYSLRASVELEVRYEHNQRQITKLKDNGVRLAWIDRHANCSDRCQQWQGKLYSLNGEFGTKDGISYQPLENATEIIDKYGYRNGCLSGFNCRHKLIPYKKGFRPVEIPEKVIQRQRELERQQRYMERTVRKYEARALMYKAENQSKMYKHYKDLATMWTVRYEDFSKKNNVPYYPSRLDL